MSIRIARAAALVIVLVAFLFSVTAIVVRGPVVRKPPHLDLSVEASPERLRRDVERIVSGFSPRDYRHIENLDRAAEWIATELRDAGLEVEIQEYETPEGRYRNVVAFQKGAEPEVGALVIGAHYDAVEGAPGANDNASGLAVLLELARTLPPVQPRSDRYFVAFSTEEPPFFGTEKMGSTIFAEKLRDEGVKVNMMVALDCVGVFSDARHSQRFPFAPLRLMYPDRGDFIAVIGDMWAGPWIKRAKLGIMTAESIEVHSFRAPASVTGVHYSDHLSFRRLGMPGVLITDTAFMRDIHYHEATDVVDRLNYERMAQVVHGLHGVLWDGGR